MFNQKPAILGGSPFFESKLHIVRPVLPDYASLEPELKEIFRSGMLTKGQHLQKLEQAMAEHLRVKYAVAVSSCTTGLMLTYRCLGLTGEVIVPSFTFMATVSALVWAGCRPVFVDVDRQTTNIDVEQIERAITPDTSAIVAVHNFGNPADLDALQHLADRHSLRLIFDAAHGLGSLYRGVPVGSQGDAQIYSLSPTKLVIGGEGGIVATNNAKLAEDLRIGREYGNSGQYDSAFAGLNARMSEMQALVARYSLAMLEEAVAERNQIAAQLRGRLEALAGIECQKIAAENRSSYKDFSLTVDEQQTGITRDQLNRALQAEGIDTRTYYDPPTHLQTAYRHFVSPHPLHNTEWLAKHSLSLPLWSKMEDQTIDKICLAIERVIYYAEEICLVSY
jgi:dTDP-4-amino-4,6-dideoxygalactose transaminase